MIKLSSMYCVADTSGFELMLLNVMQLRVCYYDFCWKFIYHLKVPSLDDFRKYFWLPCKSIRLVSYMTGEGCLVDAINKKKEWYHIRSNYNTAIRLHKVLSDVELIESGGEIILETKTSLFHARLFCVCYLATPQPTFSHY